MFLFPFLYIVQGEELAKSTGDKLRDIVYFYFYSYSSDILHDHLNDQSV